MKTTLILAVTAALSLGTLALVRAQDETKEVVEPKNANETTSVVSGIRTDLAVEQKLMGGNAEVTAIPVASVFAEGDEFFVLTRDTESSGGFRETVVTLGNTDGFNVEVKTGLLPGDEVITISASQLRFPAFDEDLFTVCGTGACETTCDPVSGACLVACGDGDACEVGAKCEKGETCTVSCTDCENCKSGVACVDCPDCPSNADLTISADEFFNGSLEMVFEPIPGFFTGQPGFCPPF